MVQPIQYLPAPANPFTRLAEGLVIGQEIGQISAQRQQAEQADRLQAEYRQDLEEAFNVGTPAAFAKLTAKYPQQREAFKQSYELLSTDQQNNEFMAGAKAFNAIKSGNIDAAKQLLETRIEAARNSGMDTSKLEAMRSGLDANPEFVANTLGMTLSAIDPERWSKMATEFRAQEMQAGELETQKLNIEKLDAETSKLLAEAGGVGKLSPKDQNELASKFRKEYSDQTKEFRETQTAFDRLNAAEDTAAGDLSLIFSYMKMLDPGSVVREGEFATAQNAAGIPTRIVNAYNNALQGTRLNPDQRKQFKSQAKALFTKSKAREKEVRSGISRIANKAGILDEDLFYVQEEMPATEGGFDYSNRPYGVFGK